MKTKIDALIEADRVQNVAIEAARFTTAKRDAAAKDLFDWVSEAKAFARAQFKDRPDIAKGYCYGG